MDRTKRRQLFSILSQRFGKIFSASFFRNPKPPGVGRVHPLSPLLYLLCSVLLVGVVAGVLWWSPWEPREPVYDGKPLTYWLDRTATPTNIPLLVPTSMATRHWYPAYPTAMHAVPRSVWIDLVRHDSSNAVPFLVRALRQDTSLGAATYREWLWPRLPPPLRQHLPSPSRSVNRPRTAAFLLSDMGREAKPAVPALIGELKKNSDDIVRIETVWALWQIGHGDTNVTAALFWALQDKSRVVRMYVTNALLYLDIEAATKAGLSWTDPARPPTWSIPTPTNTGRTTWPPPPGP
jgi:hypothetical protein